MKGKLKFLSGQAIKSWLLAHGEKVAFCLAVVTFAMFVYTAVKGKTLPLDKEPANLTAAASRAEAYVRDSQWDPKSLQPPVYVKRAEWNPVKPEDYPIPYAFDNPIKELKVKRDDPKALAIEEPRATPGSGLLALLAERKKEGAPGNDEAPAVIGDPGGRKADGVPGVRISGNSKVEGRYWAVVTALVPIKKQTAEYQKAFDRATFKDKSADVPKYIGYKIERAEVIDGKTDNLQWQLFDLRAAQAFVEKWAVEAPEIVARDYVDPMFTLPLAPLLGEDWTDAVAHLPKVPLANAETEVTAAPVVKQPEDQAEPDGEFGGVGRKPKKPGQNEGQPRPAPRIGDNQQQKVVDYTLFRFFDFTVEPGKQYCYRIQVGLQNPNKGLAAKFLKNPQSAAIASLAAPMSAPTPVVTIPRAERILAGPIPQKRPVPGSEPVATIMLTTFDLARGLKAWTTEQVMRGNVTNYEKSVEVIDFRNGQRMVQNGVKFAPNTIVLDIRGGKPLPGRDRLVEPTEVLLFDADGNIVNGGNALLARNELEDFSDFKANDASGAAGDSVEKPLKKPAAAPAGGGDIFNDVPQAKPAKPLFK